MTEQFLISLELGRTVGQLDFTLALCLFISHMEVEKSHTGLYPCVLCSSCFRLSQFERLLTE
jgi:hypothetical protein